MSANFILITLLIPSLIVAYFVLKGLFRILQSLIKNISGSLIGILVLVAVAASIYLLCNPDSADDILGAIKQWYRHLPEDDARAYFPGNNS